MVIKSTLLPETMLNIPMPDGAVAPPLAVNLSQKEVAVVRMVMDLWKAFQALPHPKHTINSYENVRAHLQAVQHAVVARPATYLLDKEML